MINNDELINENLDKINKTNFVFFMVLKEGGYFSLITKKVKKFGVFYDDSFNEIKEIEANLGMNIYNTFCFPNNLFAISDFYTESIQFFLIDNMEIKKIYKIISKYPSSIEQINENKYIIIDSGVVIYEKINDNNFQIISSIRERGNAMFILNREKFVIGYFDKLNFYNITFCQKIHQIENISIPYDVSMSLINENLLGVCSFKKLNIININNYNIVNQILMEDDFYIWNIDNIFNNNEFLLGIYKKSPMGNVSKSYIKKCKVDFNGENFIEITKKESLKKQSGLINIKGNKYIFLSDILFYINF